ncbi:MAG: oligopeptide/dipeptide ABC transporter ATP-binding protein [Paracoccaceae bacterium]
MTAPMLCVDDLRVRFATQDGAVEAVRGVSFDVPAGGALAIVGESGSGKSQTAFALLGLLAGNGTAEGSVKLAGREILNAPDRDLRAVRGGEVGIVFQDPMTSLNPYMRIGAQMAEVLDQHEGLSRAQTHARCVEMLDAVRIPDAATRLRQYPHEFSGGMRQRIMIAMALLCRPKLLIADEPTTALDVTVQAQIMDLLADLRRDLGWALLINTHPPGMVAGACDEVVVMYGGRVMERGPAGAIFDAPTHPYTRGLLSAVPRIDRDLDALSTIPGDPPDMGALPPGCPFSARCAHVREVCPERRPPLEPAGALMRACHVPVDQVRAEDERALA